MAWQLSIYSLPPAVAALIATVLVVVARRHRERPIATPFVGLVSMLAAWSVVYAIQLGFTDLASQLRWWKVGICAAVTIPPLWLWLTATYAGADDLLTRPRRAFLAAEPAVFAALVWTNPFGGVVVRDAVMRGTPRIVEITFGVGYLAHISLAYLFVAAGVLLLARVYVRTARIYRKQAAGLIVAAVFPLLANVAFTLGIGPVPGLDFTTFAFTLTGAFMGLALFRFDLLDRSPVAHRSVIDELGDGIVVYDEEGRVVDYNANAARILGDDPERADELPDDPADAEGREFATDLDGSRRTYHVTTSGLEDFRGERVGTVLALRDVTHRHRYEQRLEVTNRILRHNLRNDANVIYGQADQLAERIDGQAAERADAIREKAMDLATLGEKAADLEATLAAEDGSDAVVAVADVARRVTERVRRSHPHVDVHFEASDDAYATVPSRDLLGMALSNLIENAIEHNDADEPAVAVGVDATGEHVRISIEDNGPGIPEVEYRVLEEGRETALEHGSGLGLWLVYWVVSAVGGDVAFEESASGGSVVRLALPAAEPA